MTALRHTMRKLKPWEVTSRSRTNSEWGIKPPERDSILEEDLIPYLAENELEYISDKDNKPTAILYLQSHQLRILKDKGLIWEFAFLELEEQIKDLFTLQGKSERIKNFPYPRQFATLNHYFMWVFILLLPLALVAQLSYIGKDSADAYPLVTKFFV